MKDEYNPLWHHGYWINFGRVWAAIGMVEYLRRNWDYAALIYPVDYLVWAAIGMVEYLRRNWDYAALYPVDYLI